MQRPTDAPLQKECTMMLLLAILLFPLAVIFEIAKRY